MAANSAISWCDHTFNPWWGCLAVSPACKHCYAEEWAERFPKTRGLWGVDAPRKIGSKAVFDAPLKWNADARKKGEMALVFTSSMSDFMEQHSDSTINAELDIARARTVALIEQTPWLLWLILTKRPQNARHCLPHRWFEPGAWPANVMIGCTIEDQQHADERLPILCQIPGDHFISMAPLLEAVCIQEIRSGMTGNGFKFARNAATLKTDAIRPLDGLQHSYVSTSLKPVATRAVPGRVVWVITEGESGKKARESETSWFTSSRDQCAAAKKTVHFHHKQNGEWLDGKRVGLKKAGRRLCGVIHDARPIETMAAAKAVAMLRQPMEVSHV